MDLLAEFQAVNAEFQSHRFRTMSRIIQLETLIKLASSSTLVQTKAFETELESKKKEISILNQMVGRSFKGALLNEAPAQDPIRIQLSDNNKKLAQENANLKHQISVLKENAKKSKRDLTHAQADKETYKLMFEKQVAITSQMAEDEAELQSIVSTLMKDNDQCRDRMQELSLQNAVLQTTLAELEASVADRERKWRLIFERKQNKESSSS
jgi:hypothetical protein